MAKSRFNIKGTKDFLVAAVFCGAICIWAIRDAWFPPESVLEKHPLEVPVAFEVPGVVKSINVKVGEKVEGRMTLATLYEASYQEAVDEAQAAFEKAKEEKAPDVDEKLDALLAARERLDACTLENTDITVTTSHGESALHGEVLRVDAQPAMQVETMTADEGGTVLKVASDAVFIGEEDAALKDAVKYPLNGFAPTVHKEQSVAAGETVAGTTILVINPEDSFYIFNQTLAVIMFLGMIASLIFHWIASH